MAQADWLGSKDSGHLVLCYIHLPTPL